MSPEQRQQFGEMLYETAAEAAERRASQLKVAVVTFATELTRILMERDILDRSDVDRLSAVLHERAVAAADTLPATAQDTADIAATLRIELLGRDDRPARN